MSYYKELLIMSRPSKTKDKKDFIPLYYASCPKGFEELLIEEMSEFDLEPKRTTVGGVYFFADHFTAIKFLLNTRIASRLYLNIHKFTIGTEKDIYKECEKVKWSSIFDVKQTFKIQTKLTKSIDGKRKSKFNNNIYLSQVLKDSIVDHFRSNGNKRPSVDRDDADVQFMLHVYPENKATSKWERADLFIDLCGMPLSNRGYRRMRFSAPLRENLAAGLVKYIRQNTPVELQHQFLDIMTGSGTMLIEYAYNYCNIAPTYIHLYDHFEDGEELPWIFHKQTFYKKEDGLGRKVTQYMKKLFEQSQKNFDNIENLTIIGTDISNKSLSSARDCLHFACLIDDVTLEKRDARKYYPENFKGIVFANPPYGMRLGEDEKLGELYYQIGENLKQNFKDSCGYIFTGNRELIKDISLRSSKKIPVYNGDLDSRLVEYRLY